MANRLGLRNFALEDVAFLFKEGVLDTTEDEEARRAKTGGDTVTTDAEGPTLSSSVELSAALSKLSAMKVCGVCNHKAVTEHEKH